MLLFFGLSVNVNRNRYIIDREAFYSTIMQLPLDLFNQWKSIHDRICSAYDELWLCIRDVLCADAPEGHVPEDMEDETGIDTKEILSYSWRGLKEARCVVSACPRHTID